MSTQHNVCVPMKLEAFRLNTAASHGPSRLAPISQPDYAHLRLDELLTHDVQKDVDLHNTARGPAFSDRITDLMTGEVKRNRLGIYIRWLIPRFYRTGLSVTQSSEQGAPDLRNKRGYRSVDEAQGVVDPQSPTYRQLPTRWAIVRHLLTKDPPDANVPEFQAFAIESDRLRQMEDLGPEVDIQVDVSPFVYMDRDRNSIDYQAETFIGFKQPLAESISDRSILRVPLSVLTSTNPLFIDYQPHNTNVFSMIDNFAYDDSTGGTAYLQSATANYYVMGWHSDANDDPCHLFDQQIPYPTHADRLDACFMQLAGTSDDTDNWMKSSLSLNEPTRVITHGALYDVEWQANGKPGNVPADVIARSYNECSPVSVGVNPVDALLAVTHTRALMIDKENEDNGNENSKPDPLAQDLLSLQTLVIKQQEDPDSQLQGADQLFTSYFVPAESGQRWHVSGAATSTDDKRPTVPSAQELSDLETVNTHQMALDLCTREMKWLQWQIWAEWWKYVSSHRQRPDDEREAVKNKVNDMVNRHTLLDIETQGWKQIMQEVVQRYNWETVTAPRYYSSRDPTMLLCGMKSGWPTDFSDLVKVRLDSQLVAVNDIYDAVPERWANIDSSLSAISQKLPAPLRDTAKALLTEFYALRPVPADTPHVRPSPDSKLLYPLYHDQDPSAASDSGDKPVWRDQWNGTQPWFPLFAEWEMEYFHIDVENWVLASRESYGPPKLFAKIKDGVDIKGVTNTQSVTGRSLVLPQTMSMLKNTVEQLVKNKSTKPEDMDAIHAAINKLQFLTLSISGLSGHLTTRQRGSHLSPTMYEPGYGPQPLVEAINASQGVIDENAIRLMFDTTMTPFGDFPDFEDATHSPFKPATHGQFRFTKLNIIDMFGQAVSAIDPSHGVLPNLLPYISKFYACQVDDSSDPPVPRTVRPGGTTSDVGAQFAQMGPAINQDSRLNAHYVKWEGNAWVPVTEYDNPIWGWLVVNYVDNGLQVFLPDGTFYREIRLGGPDGVSSGIRAWLPFKAPGDDTNIPPQLRALMRKLKNAHYLQEFFDVMAGALDDTMYTPNQYTGYLPAITGKPFALVNTGWSLELSHPPHINQSTSVPSSAAPEPSLESYGFQVKFGDPDRTFDGLLGYFREKSRMDFDLENFYTYFPGVDASESLTVLIEPDNYPALKPFYNSAGSSGLYDYNVKTPAQMLTEYNNRLEVFGMLVDPFTAIHGYTGIQLALEQSLKNITAFFHLGPIIMPHDAPPYDPAHELTSSSSLDNISDPPEGTPKFLVPSVAITDWAWLQPYAMSMEVDSITFNPFSLSAISGKPELGSTPYTAVEGYLYLKKPITSPGVSPAPA
ncbi:hypothetical protein Hypma_009192 [Hypsizygus marmoreus]|uniref:Uncharacterized protein n=1 Tax=Hypsizygus marmoreus TaxID=39966 RepID=A0A369JN37_HYPMA|nr:hypothetical protein Hypma_009192 [Hypsizygus marmoreus]